MSDLVPDGWTETKIGNLSTKVGSGVTPRGGSKAYSPTGVTFIRSQNVHYSGLKLNDVVFISEEIHSSMSSSQLSDGDVLLNITGASIGRCTFVPEGFGDANVNQHVCIIRPNEKVTTRYLSQWFSSDYGKDSIELYQAGGNREGLNFQQIRSMSVRTPPLPEQQKIAAILSSVDEVIEKTQAQINKLKDLKTGMMQELLSPREDQAANINNPQGESENGLHHTEFKDSPLGRIPVGWEVEAISSLCTNVVDCVNKTAPVVDYPTPYKMIRTTNVRHGLVDTENVRFVTKETYDTWTRRMLPIDGDLIFTREAPVGECGILRNSKGIFLGQRTMMYRTDPTKVDSHLLMYSLQSDYCQAQIEDFSGGSTVAHMRVPDCGKILIKVPTLAEQAKISAVIGSVVDSIEIKQFKLLQLKNTKKALMQDLLTGKVRVTVHSHPCDHGISASMHVTVDAS